jgi:hypothetical protein
MDIGRKVPLQKLYVANPTNVGLGLKIENEIDIFGNVAILAISSFEAGNSYTAILHLGNIIEVARTVKFRKIEG